MVGGEGGRSTVLYRYGKMVSSQSKRWKIFAFALLLGIVKGEPSKILSTMVKRNILEFGFLNVRYL